MSAGRLLAALVLAIIMPPVGLWMRRSIDWAFVVGAVLFAGSQIIFWFLYAVPGLGLWLLAIGFGLLFTLIRPRGKLEKRA